VNHFTRVGAELWAEGVPLRDVADHYGTPTYVYSNATLTRHVAVLQEGLRRVAHRLCYAVKANANLSLLARLYTLGCDFDAVSGGELARLQHLGIAGARTILSGVGKTDQEIAQGLQAGVSYLAVESAAELAAVARVAEGLGTSAPVALRVNPDVDARTHPYIATGLKTNKFGVPWAEAEGLYLEARASPWLVPVGVTCHIGSQITELAPFADAAKRMRDIVLQLRSAGVPLSFIGMGGGLGVPYLDEQPPAPDHYGETLADILGDLGLTLVLEPGRVIVGNAGVLLTRVTRVKERFLIVDAGMNDLLRPALYGARHAIEAVKASAGSTRYRVVGPVCESADTFDDDVALPNMEEGDLVIVRTAAAYGFAMASTYNGRPLAAEVWIDGEQMRLARRRMHISELWRGESLG
jgi:diaminopimelate decarboxylase